MTVRLIDGNKLIEWFRPYLHTGEAIPADVVIEDILSMPTLTPPNEPRMINADKLAKRIAGHSNYHGDSILAAIYCAAEGKENDALIRPIETPPNEWVSVENALPPNMDDVLVVVQNNGECWTVTGYYSNTSNVWYAMLNGQDTQMDVLWWMPLPAPPAKVDES